MVAEDQLKTYVERVERLAEEKQGLSNDISDIFKEAKSQGFDVKAMKEVIKLRKLAKAEREELESSVDLYKSKLGL